MISSACAYFITQSLLDSHWQYSRRIRRSFCFPTAQILDDNAKSIFPTDDSLLKMLYLAMMDITKKWTGRRQDWSLIHAQMAIYFAERMPE